MSNLRFGANFKGYHFRNASYSTSLGRDFDLYPFGSDPILLHETFLASHPNGIIFESDPVWVTIADPNGFESIESRVNARRIRYSLGTDPCGSDLA